MQAAFLEAGANLGGEIDAIDARVDALEAVAWHKKSITLSAQDVSNGYVDMDHEVVAFSMSAYVNRLAIHEAEDYTLSVVGGVSRLTFIGSIAASGEEAVEAGDKIFVKYQH